MTLCDTEAAGWVGLLCSLRQRYCDTQAAGWVGLLCSLRQRYCDTEAEGWGWFVVFSQGENTDKLTCFSYPSNTERLGENQDRGIPTSVLMADTTRRPVTLVVKH